MDSPAGGGKTCITVVFAQRSFLLDGAMLIFGWEASAMFDVYLSDRRVLLVVRKGFSIPIGDAPSRWRKSKKRVISVSDEIGLAVHRHGYYMRRLTASKKSYHLR